MGYDNNSTQNQNVFQPTERNLGISSVNIKFILFKKVAVNSTITSSPFYHTSWKTFIFVGK